MASRRQTETDAPAGNPGSTFGNPTTLILLILAAVFLFWQMRRRRAFEERIQSQRREQRLVDAEASAREIANVMRTVPKGAAAAAAAEGLASAAPVPAPSRPDSDGGGNGAGPAVDDAGAMRALERAEAAAEADRVAAEEARRVAFEAETGGRSDARRMAAAAAASVETRADDAEATGMGIAAATTAGTGDAPTPPAGAVAGDGTTQCPTDFPIKGNASSRIYHEPGQSSYGNTIPEFCFSSAEAAEAAGFRQSRARGQRGQE